LETTIAMPETEAPAFRTERLALLSALVDGDVTIAFRLATKLLDEGLSFEQLVTDIVAPVQHELGRRWAMSDLGVADEHAASAAVEELAIRLAATLDAPRGAKVVIACAEHDLHALGSRVVASLLTLEGFRALPLGPSIPPTALSDYLEIQEPLALALSVSVTSALANAASSIAVAHQAGVPVVAGGQAFRGGDGRARRLGADAFASTPSEAVEVLRAWEVAPPQRLVAAPAPVPEHDALVRVVPDLPPGALANEMRRLVAVVESALLVDEPALVADQIAWLRETADVYGIGAREVDDAVHRLHDAIPADLERARTLLRQQ
jgi:methanogenic corrinoid protein MtbC1